MTFLSLLSYSWYLLPFQPYLFCSPIIPSSTCLLKPKGSFIPCGEPTMNPFRLVEHLARSCGSSGRLRRGRPSKPMNQTNKSDGPVPATCRESQVSSSDVHHIVRPKRMAASSELRRLGRAPRVEGQPTPRRGAAPGPVAADNQTYPLPRLVDDRPQNAPVRHRYSMYGPSTPALPALTPTPSERSGFYLSCMC